MINLVVKSLYVSGEFLMLGQKLTVRGQKGTLLDAGVKKPLARVA